MSIGAVPATRPGHTEVTGRLYIDGHWSDGAAGWPDVIDPSTERVVGRAAQASAADAAAAAAAARAAQRGWEHADPQERAVALDQISLLISARSGELAALTMTEGGFTRPMAGHFAEQAAAYFAAATRRRAACQRVARRQRSDLLRADTRAGAPRRPPSLLGVLAQVFSRGRVTVTSADPYSTPEVELNPLSDERDRVRFRALVRHLRDVLTGPVCGKRVSGVRDLSGAPVDLDAADKALDQRAASVVQDTAHLCGSCRMGDPAAPTSVVGPDCRVLGFDGLYVADVSIFPTVTRANTNITAVMVGERAADLPLGRTQT